MRGPKRVTTFSTRSKLQTFDLATHRRSLRHPTQLNNLAYQYRKSRSFSDSLGIVTQALRIFFERTSIFVCGACMTKKNDNWPETRESLILRVKNPKDIQAWDEFSAIYRPVVYRMARGRGLQDADAEDLTQQVFASIARAIDSFETGDDQPPFRGWLYRIARNAILNALTRKKPDRAAGSTSVQKLLASEPEPNHETTQELEWQGRLQTTRFAAEQIRTEYNDATWQMFYRTAINGETVAQVAKDLNRTAGAVYMARYRVTQRLKDKVNEINDSWSIEP